MFTRIIRFTLLLTLLCGAVGRASEEAQTPETLIAALYKQHETESPFFQTENRKLLDRFFTASLASALWKDAKESQGEVGAIGFDPLFDAQDTEISYFAIHQAKVDGDTATVTVTFSNFGKKVKIVFALTVENDSWRIADIRYAKNLSLAGLLTGEH